MTIEEKIQQDRAHGELLGPLVGKYGADAVVKALGVGHVACSLGVCDDDTDEPIGSCDNCGVNVYEDEDDGSGLCGQCQWFASMAGD